MPTPLDMLRRYRALKINTVYDDPKGKVCREIACQVQLKSYFIMNWKDEAKVSEYDANSSGDAKHNEWYRANKENIRTAAMGKGSPHDYELALEWAIRSGKIPTPDQPTIQAYCDKHFGIDCSGFVTNYLIANGKKGDSNEVRRNTGATSYYSPGKAVNDATAVAPGNLLVMMNGNHVKSDPGHVTVVESYSAQSKEGGNMRIVEATGADGAQPKLLDSLYSVEEIIPKGKDVPVMILVVTRHGTRGKRFAVMSA